MATTLTLRFNFGRPGGLGATGLSLLAALLLPAVAGAADLAPLPPRTGEVMAQLQASFARHEQYQCEIEVQEFSKGRPDGSKRFFYSFKKPNLVRLDMIAPHRGMTLIYPDQGDKVLVRPGWAGSFALHLSPGNPLLKGGGGQRLDQTDLGQLIANIGRSLNEWRRGEARVEEQAGRLLIEVLSRDHFDPEAVTLYRFYLDPALWLPVGIEELTPERLLKRTTVFRNLHPTTLPAEFFRGNDQRGTR